MSQSNRDLPPPARGSQQVPIHLRSPQRITITINWATHERLLKRSCEEGRSLSNLASRLLELGLADCLL